MSILSEIDRRFSRQRGRNRLIMKAAAVFAGYGFGEPDDEHLCLEECGINFGDWTLWCEDVGHENVNRQVWAMTNDGEEEILVAKRVTFPAVARGLTRLKEMGWP